MYVFVWKCFWSWLTEAPLVYFAASSHHGSPDHMWEDLLGISTGSSLSLTHHHNVPTSEEDHVGTALLGVSVVNDWNLCLGRSVTVFAQSPCGLPQQSSVWESKDWRGIRSLSSSKVDEQRSEIFFCSCKRTQSKTFYLQEYNGWNKYLCLWNLQ